MGSISEKEMNVRDYFGGNITQSQIEFVRHVIRGVVEIDFASNCTKAAEDVAAITGKAVHCERFTRFVKNTNHRNREEDYNPKPENLQIYARYLIEKNLIETEDLIDVRISYAQIPAILAIYLNEDDHSCYVDYNGLFRHMLSNEKLADYERRLKISSSITSTFLNIRENLDQTGPICAEDEYYGSQVRMGWGVFVQEDMVVIFTKDIRTRMSYSYISLSVPMKSEIGRVEKLYLMQQQHLTIPSVDKADTKNKLENAIKNNILEFQRVEMFSGIDSKPVVEVEDKQEYKTERKTKGKSRKDYAKLASSPFSKTTRRYPLATQPETMSRNWVTERHAMGDSLGRQLIRAVNEFDIETVKRLATKGGASAVNYQDPETGCTGLHCAVANNDLRMVDALLQTGLCDVSIPDHRGRFAYTMPGSPMLRKKIRQFGEAQGTASPAEPPDQGGGPQ